MALCMSNSDNKLFLIYGRRVEKLVARLSRRICSELLK